MIDEGQIEYLLNGERAEADVLNRPLRQLVSATNDSLSEVNDAKADKGHTHTSDDITDIGTANLPRLSPTLNLNFMKVKHLDPRIEFTRSSTATYTDAVGKIRTVAINKPRFTSDPVTGEALGLLVEGQATNLLRWSEDLSNAAWSKYDESFWEFSISSKPSPIAGVNFSQFSVPQDVDAETSLYYQTYSSTEDTDYVFSFIVAKEYNLLRYCQIDGMANKRSIFDIDTGTFTSRNLSHTTRVIDMGDSWMVGISFTAENTTARVGVMPMEVDSAGYINNFTAGGYQYTTGFQLEEGSTPSSYIKTEDAQVTRVADNVTRELGEEFNRNNGVLLFSFTAPSSTRDNYPNVFSINGEIRVEIRPNGAVYLDLRSVGGEFPTMFSSGTIEEGKNYNLAVSYSNNSIQLVLNGVASTTIQLSSPIFSSQEDYEFRLGRRSRGNYMYSPIGKFSFIPSALSEAELQEITK